MYQSLQNPLFMPKQGLPAYWCELVVTRDSLFSSLMEQLTLNKILLQNSMSQKLNSKPTNDASSQNQNNPVSENFAPQLSQNMNQNKVEEESERAFSQNQGLRNDTKNIPKNYGKAILSFVQTYPKSRQIVTSMGVNFPDFLMHVRRLRKKVNSIEGLKKMWGAGSLTHKMKKCIRILSYIFMRKHCLSYIFHSKVKNYPTHIKYRKKLIEGIEKPDQFNHIKDY